jgi:exosortase D (VPLPA-CTERM-specific)
MKAKENIFQNLLFQVIALSILFAVAYWIPLKGIVNTWMTNDDYSYGFLIPVITGYLLWEKRYLIREYISKSSWSILPLLIFFVLLSIYGILGSSGYISRPAIPILIILLVAFCFGIELAKKLILPLGFLVFMVPLPSVVDRTFGVFLKKISSELGGLIIRMWGFSVHVSGNVIDLGATQLQVVDACSGLRFVFPLLALGVLCAYFFERVAWKRIVLVLSTIPIAIFTNVLRIGITGILTNIYGTKVADGFFHGFSGWAIFMVAFAFIFLLGRVLQIFPSKKPLKLKDFGNNPAPETGNPAPKVGGTGAFVVSIFLLIVVGGLSWNTKSFPPIEIRGGIESFPLKFDNWSGRMQLVDPEIIIASGAEEAFQALYKNNENNPVSLYMGYRKTAFLENENFFHSPTVCLPASGWKNRETATHTIPDVPFFNEVKVTKMVIEGFGGRQLVYFWFQTKSKTTHDKNINRFHLALHAIKRDNTHDLFIQTLTPLKSSETIEDAQARLDKFVREMMQPLIVFLAERQIVAN